MLPGLIYWSQLRAACGPPAGSAAAVGPGHRCPRTALDGPEQKHARRRGVHLPFRAPGDRTAHDLLPVSPSWARPSASPSAGSRTTCPTYSAGNGHPRPWSTRPSCAASKTSQARKDERSWQRRVRIRASRYRIEVTQQQGSDRLGAQRVTQHRLGFAGHAAILRYLVTIWRADTARVCRPPRPYRSRHVVGTHRLTGRRSFGRWLLPETPRAADRRGRQALGARRRKCADQVVL